ncbi:MAG: GAF domain-containing sensor histidine kinase [Microcoleus vaginatus WJT46-NPBG5]|nr:GAF domain-containing sensor histidine kinase [Microcoleus vaginatus WJT46-NPBG5]
MIAPENKQMDSLDSLSAAAQEDQRLLMLAELGLLEAQKVPVFEEAVQAAADFLEIPICILGVLDKDRQWLKAAVGLSDLLPLKQHAQIHLLRSECFCSQVVESAKVLAIRDTANHPLFAHRSLVQQYGIRAYLGVPLLTSTGHCLGTLAVMDLAPRTFTVKEIQFLELTARWCMSEFERQRLAGEPSQLSSSSQAGFASQSQRGFQTALKQIKAEMLTHVTQALRTPLTSVMGMASVLERGIYGPLNNKQQEYLEIIHGSGRYLISLVDEILALGELDDSMPELRLTAIDIEMLCQQVINALEQDASRREQEIRLSVEPGHRIWMLDKLKIQQLLYNLLFCVIQSATAGSIVRLHVSRRISGLNIAVWVSHPWLGEGLPLATLSSCPLSELTLSQSLAADEGSQLPEELETPVLATHATNGQRLDQSNLAALVESDRLEPARQLFGGNRSREGIGLLLSCLLAEMHNGDISIQGSPESGYRYVVSLPEVTASFTEPYAG